MIQTNAPIQNGGKVSRAQNLANQLTLKDKTHSQKTDNSNAIGGIRVRPMRMMSRTSSLNEKVVVSGSEVKSTKNSSLMQSGNKSNSIINFVNTERKNPQKAPSPVKQARGDKLFADDKSSATLKTESTNHSNGTASKGSSEKSQDENPDQSNFSSVFFSP